MSTRKSTPTKPDSEKKGVNPEEVESLLAQLRALYIEREELHTELGVSDAESIITMVRSLTAQLEAIYQEHDEEGS